MSDREFEHEFFERFAENCEDRLSRIHIEASRCAAGETTQEDAVETVCGLVHNIAGEAALLGLVWIAAAGKALNVRLRHMLQSGSDSFDAKLSLCETFVRSAQRMARAQDDATEQAEIAVLRELLV